MTPVSLIVVLIIGIVFLMALLLRFKMHPVLAIFIATILIGLGTGNTLVETVNMINQGFGNTLGGVGVTIILGTIIAMGILDTGATASIANFFIKLFKGKRMELASAIPGFILAIPVFGDVGMVLTAPIASFIGFRNRISMSTMTAWTGLALFLTHGLVPPTPGILAVALMFEADLGMVILWGIIVSLIAFFVTYFLLRKWVAKEWIAPKEEFKKGLEPAKEGASVSELLIKEEDLPPTISAVLPILVPVVLIATASLADVYMAEGFVQSFLTTIGNRIVALSTGVVIAFLIALGRKGKVVGSAHYRSEDASQKDMGFMETIFNNWVARGLTIALLPLLITGMGGAMGFIYTQAPAAEELGEIIAGTGLPPLMIPFLITAVLFTVVGSMTVAALTGAAIVLPMMPTLGLSITEAVLAIGAGSLFFSHFNNSGFWVLITMFGLKPHQGLKYSSVPNMLAGFVALIAIYAFSAIGFI